jgi:HK97 family phage portal protein
MTMRDWMPPALYRAYSGLKSSATVGVIVQAVGLSQPVMTPRTFEALAREGFGRNPMVYRAVLTLATACAGVKLRAYADNTGSSAKDSSGRQDKELPNHPLLKLLTKPNPGQGGASLIRDFVAYLILEGNSYLEAVGPETRMAPPVELYALRPDRMRILPDARNKVGGYEYGMGNNKVKYLPRGDGLLPVMHSKLFAPLDDWYGLSPIKVAALAIDVRNQADEWGLSLLQNSARPPGFFSAKGTLPDHVYSRIKRDLEERYSGVANAGKPGLLEGDMTWVQSGLGPLDMDWFNMSREKSRDIAVTIGVPSELLGDSSNKTYSNFQEARRSMYTESALPLLDTVLDDLNNWLPRFYDGGVRIAYDRNDIDALQEDRAAVWNRTLNAVARGVLTIDEAREELGKSPLPKGLGEAILVPSSVKPLEQVLNPPAPPPQLTPGVPGTGSGGNLPDDSTEPGDQGGKDPLDALLSGKSVRLLRVS